MTSTRHSASSECSSTVEVREPPKFRVILLNDDYTTMEFVIRVLLEIFRKDQPTAYNLMMTVHLQGHAVVGIYPRSIAETKVEQVSSSAREAGFPLRCTLEPVS